MMPFFKYIPAKKNLLVALLAPVLFLLSNVVYAQKWYQVEVLVFTQSDSFGDETSVPEAKLKYPLNWVELAAAGSNNKFTVIDKAARRLNPDAYTMNSTGVYKVLYHQAWRQPGISPRNAPWLIVSGGRTFGDHRQLEGSIRLHLSSYLHLETNLWLLRPINEAGFRSKYLSTNDVPISPLRSRGSQSSGAFRSGSGIELSRIDLFRQSERLKLGKTHYLDHPKMGILVKVVRAKAPGAAAAASSPPQNASESQAP